MYYQAKSEIEEKIVQAGEQASFEANVPGLHPELIRVLGRLNYRTSYGQNVLRHSLECAHLAAMMAAEMGANQKVARRAALLHDIGKAVTHEVEGSHAIISGQLCKKHGESPAVVHAVEAHHYDVEPQTVEAVLVQAADAISAARPGARGESAENYVKRLEALESIAMAKKGVEKCFAMQAGRDLRVMVKPEEIDDDAATMLVREIAKEIEASLEYPGPDQGHGDPRVAGHRVRQVALVRRRRIDPSPHVRGPDRCGDDRLPVDRRRAGGAARLREGPARRLRRDGRYRARRGAGGDAR